MHSDTCLELCGGIEFRLNGVQLHSELLLVHLDSITTFPLNLLFDQHLPANTARGGGGGGGGDKYETKKLEENKSGERRIVPGHLFKTL